MQMLQCSVRRKEFTPARSARLGAAQCEAQGVHVRLGRGLADATPPDVVVGLSRRRLHSVAGRQAGRQADADADFPVWRGVWRP